MMSEVSKYWVLRWETRDVVSFLEGREGEDDGFVGVPGLSVCGKAGREISRTICVLLTKKSSQGSDGMFGGLLGGAKRARAW